MKQLFTIIFVLVTFRLGADALSDVKAAVKRLPGSRPVRATLKIEQSVKAAGRFANDTTSRTATAEVSHDATGVSITIPQSLLDKASQETRLPNGGDGSVHDAIASIRTLEVVEALNFRDPLLALLDNANVIEEKRALFRGHQARLLVLKLNPRQQKRSGRIQLGSVKTDDRMNLWVGDESLPLAADRVQKTTAGFMLLHAKYSSHTNYTFTHMQDRLILTRLETGEGGSGAGQKIEKTSVQTVVVR